MVGADEAFFEDEDDEQAIINLYHERAGILDGDPDSEVDLASHAYQIWKNAISADPSLEKVVADLPDVALSSRMHRPIAQRPEGVLVFTRMIDGNDALTYVDRRAKASPSRRSRSSRRPSASPIPRHSPTTVATMSLSLRASGTSFGRKSGLVANSGGPPVPVSAPILASSDTPRP